MLGEHDVEAGQRVDVVTSRATHDEAAGLAGRLRGRRLADRVHVLVAEAEPEPRVDERRVGRRDHGVVGGEPVVDPAGGGHGVEVTHQLRVDGRVAGGVDPHVRAPAFLPWPSEQEADDRAVGHGGDARAALPVKKLLDLAPRRIGVLVSDVQPGLDMPVGSMASREQRCGTVEMVVGERDDGHGGGRDGVDHAFRLDRSVVARARKDGLASSPRDASL